MYLALNDEAFLPADRRKSLHSIERVFKQGQYLKVAKDENNTIVGWLYAAPANLDHSVQKVLQQRYFATNQRGVRAARIVVELHRDLVKHARFLAYDVVTSPGSHLDESNVFARILEREGWKRKGFMAALELKGAV